MSKFLGLSKNGGMIKIEDSTDKKGYKWYFLDKNVMTFVKTIQVGADVTFKNEEKNGEDTITYITTGGSKTNSNVVATSSKSDGGYKCETCGATLKDNKYKKCYACGMEAKNNLGNSPVSSGGDTESKSRQTSIEKQAMMKSAADAVATAMQGQVDLNTLGEQICSLYDKLLAKLLE